MVDAPSNTEMGERKPPASMLCTLVLGGTAVPAAPADSIGIAPLAPKPPLALLVGTVALLPRPPSVAALCLLIRLAKDEPDSSSPSIALSNRLFLAFAARGNV